MYGNKENYMIEELREFCKRMRELGWTCEVSSWENKKIEGYSIVIEKEKNKKSDYIG